jgi:phosphopantetheine--protein transferase-like protein
MAAMNSGQDIPVQDWAQPGDPFRLVAVAVDAVEWSGRLSAAARVKTERFADPVARARAGASEWLKACWLPKELGRGAVEWKTGANGKPLLAGAAAEWGFNLSHAGGYAVAVLAHGAAVGVDLESMSRKADIARLGERVFSESEQALVRNGGREAFFALWSQKEALLKALGCGWADGRIVRRTRLERVAFQVEPQTRVKVWARPVLDGAYMLAVALTGVQ